MRHRRICLNLQTFYLIKTGPLPNTLILISSYFSLFTVFLTSFFLRFSMLSCDNTPGLHQQKAISTLSALLLHLGFVGVILFPLTSVPLKGHPIEPLSSPRPKSQVRENFKKPLWKKKTLEGEQQTRDPCPWDGQTCKRGHVYGGHNSSNIYLFNIIVDMSQCMLWMSMDDGPSCIFRYLHTKLDLQNSMDHIRKQQEQRKASNAVICTIM